MHTVETTDEKPNIVRHCDATKGGTDNYDKLCHSYTVSGRTNRSFFGILDQAAVNARILLKCKCKKSGINNKTLLGTWNSGTLQVRCGKILGLTSQQF